MLSIISVISGFCGCSGSKSRTVGNIASLATVYYGMESSPVYSFSLQKKNDILQKKDIWYFSASCAVGEKKDRHTSFDFFPLTAEEAEKFLAVLSEEKTVTRLRMSIDLSRIFRAADAPSRNTVIVFENGSRIEKNTDLGEKTRNFLYELADRHCAEAEKGTIESFSVSSSCMDNSFSYFFMLEKNEDAWYFSFDAAFEAKEYARVEKNDVRLDDSEAERIFELVGKHGITNAVLQYREPEDNGEFWLDATEYNTSFVFVDGSRVHAPIEPGSELTGALYKLAENYI